MIYHHEAEAQDEKRREQSEIIAEIEHQTCQLIARIEQPANSDSVDQLANFSSPSHISWPVLANWIQQNCARQGKAAFYSMPIGEEGSVNYHIFSPDFALMVNRLGAPRQEIVTTSLYGSDWYVIALHIEGKLFRSEDPLSLRAKGDMNAVLYDASVINDNRTVIGTGQPVTTLLLLFTHRYLVSRLGDSAEQVLELLQANDDEQVAFISIPLSAELHRLGSELANLNNQDRLKMLHAESQSLNLLSIALNNLRYQAESPGDAVKYRTSEVERLHRVKSRIQQHCSDPLTIQALSQWSGLNRRKLSEGFKALFGMTVKEYQVMQRMMLASRLLQSGRSVTEVSEQVGYQELSSFSKAFKGYFECSPSEYLAM